MKVSIFTPTNNAKYLFDAYLSIKNQDFHEWVILHNNGSKPLGFTEPRIRELQSGGPPLVGFLKREACGYCTGDILLELDHDDILMPDAISKVKAAFQDPDVGFVYSNAIHCDLNYQPTEKYDTRFGWVYRKTEFHGLDEYVSFDPHPANVARVWYAPDHLRAFRRDIYDKVGGHNPTMRILDDLELMCRMYLVTKFKHIDEPLYVFRVTGKNSWLAFNKEIQDGVYPIYHMYIEQMSRKWAKDNGLLALELGGRLNPAEGYETVDIKSADYCTDLNEAWPFADNSVGVVRAYDVFEHLKSPLHTMKELYRVLCPGGIALIRVPSTDGRGAFQDPTHVSFWNENSFLYYTRAQWAQYIDYPVRFHEVVRFTTPKDEIQVCWTVAHLLKSVPGIRLAGVRMI